MNDLFSTSSFKKYQDLKHQVSLDDMESGKETVNLDNFFHDIDSLKNDMKEVENLHTKLHRSHQHTNSLHTATAVKQARATMDTDVAHLLKRVHTIKTKLEALERSNAESRKNPGCGPGSTSDRTRTSVVCGLGKKLTEQMEEFQRLRGKVAEEYRETVERRYFTVTGQKAEEEVIEKLIASGESERFMQKAIQEQGKAQIMDTVAEIQERHDAVKEIERSLIELHQVFLDMGALVEAQGHQLNDIESHVAKASSFVTRGAASLQEAKEYQKSSRKWTCYAILLFILLACLILLPLMPHFIA